MCVGASLQSAVKAPAVNGVFKCSIYKDITEVFFNSLEKEAGYANQLFLMVFLRYWVVSPVGHTSWGSSTSPLASVVLYQFIYLGVGKYRRRGKCV